MAGFNQNEPDSTESMFAHGFAYPAKMTFTIELRSVAYSSASRSCGFRSSRFLALSGFVLIVMFVTSDVGTDWTSKRESVFNELMALNGTWSAKSMLPESRSAIIDVELV